MSALRARMKAGCRPIIVECSVVPEYPTYWAVPASVADAIDLLVQDGQIEYEPRYARGEGGAFAPQPALEVVARPAPPAKAFQRKRGG